jgi:hypothetical protein
MRAQARSLSGDTLQGLQESIFFCAIIGVRRRDLFSMRSTVARVQCSLACSLILGASGCAHHGPPELPAVAPYYIWVDPSPTCSDSSPRFLPPVRASDTVSRPTKYDQEQLEAWLARRVPGGYSFGTMVDSLHNIGLLWLREPNQKKQALAVLDTLLPPNYPNFRRTHPDSVVIRKVRWDYAELYDWMHYLQSSMRDLKGAEITMWATDPLGDRLLFGIVNREMLPAMVNWLVGKNIPCRLVQLTIVGRASLL